MATLKLRRGSSFTSPQISEPFFNSSNNTMLVGFGTSNGEHITLVKLGANTGSVELTGDLTASNITLSGDLSARNVTLSGNIILGDEIADNINVTGQFSGSLIPSQSNEYDLGTSSKKWRNLHVVSGTIDDITLPGSNIVSSSQQISDYGVFLEFNGDNVVSGSIQIDHDQTTNFVSNEHINHSSVSIIAGDGMSGGGNILTSKTLTLNTGSDHFLEGVKKKINTEDVVSGSVQVDHDATTNFVANEHIDHTSVSITAGDGLTGGGTIASTRTINVESANNGITINADNIELVTNSSTFTDGVKAKLNTETVVSGSVQVDHDSTTNFVANEHIDHTTVSITAGNGLTGGGTIASTRTINIGAGNGITVNSDDIEVDMSVFDTGDLSEGSNLYYTDARVKTKLNTETVLSGSSQLTTEFDTRYLNTDGDSVVSGSSQVPMGGDLSGNADNVTVDKVKGVSITSGEATQLSNINSVTISNTQWGYLGDSNQGISTTDNVTFADGDFTGDVSITGNLSVLGSATEIQTSELRVEDKLITVASGSADSAAADGAGIEIDGANKSLVWDHNTSQFVFDAQVSSSVGFKGEGGLLTGIDTDQVTEATNLYYTDTRVKTKLNSENVHSGSYLGTSTTTNLSEGTNLYYTDTRVKTKLNTEGVISGSSQVNANTITNFDSNVKSKLDADGVISGSSQVVLNDAVKTGFDTDDVAEGSNLYYTDTRVKTKLNTEGVISGSSQVNANTITNFDSNVKAKLNADGVISGSSQVSLSGFNTEDLSEGSDNLYYTDTRVKTKLNTEGVISGSSQVNANTITNFDSNVDARLDAKTVVSGSTFSSPSQGTVRATINGSNTDVDTGLQTGDSPSFTGLTLSGLTSGVSSNLDAIFDVSGVLKKRTLGTAAFFNVSSSVADDPNSIPTNAAVDAALVAAGAGDITAVNDTSLYSSTNTGIKHTTDGTETSGEYGQQGNIVLAIDTGSSHFQSGVELYSSTLPSGVVSGSSQVVDVLNTEGVISGSSQVSLSGFDTGDLSEGSNLYYTDARVKTKLDAEGVISGSSQIDHDATTNFVANEHIDHSTITVGSGKGLSGGGTIDTSRSIFLDTGSAHFDDGIKKIMNGDGVVSGSSQVNSLFVGTAVSTSIDDRLDTLEGESHENPLTFSDTAQVDLIRTTNTITANLKGGVISGSAQVNDAFIGTAVSTSLDSRIDSLETDSHTHTNKSNLDSINQDLNTTDNVQFGDLLLSGDLTVQGTTVTLNTAELNIEDKLISVASGSTTSAQADGAGLHISGADESITWDHGNSRFNISDDVYAVGTIKASSDIVAYASSDIELKNNIKPIQNPIEKINQISGNSFVWNEEKQNIYKGKDYGVIAQEIEEILPELVQTRQDGYKAVKYDKLVSLLIEGIKHLSNEVNELKGKIK